MNELKRKTSDLELYKTPQERLLELGFVIDDETNCFIKYVFNGLEIILYKKEKTYQTYVYQDNYNPIDLELAEIKQNNRALAIIFEHMRITRKGGSYNDK